MAKQSLNLPYLLLAGTVVIGIMVASFIFRPQWQDWQAQQEQLRTVEERLANRRDFLLAVDRKKTQLAQQAEAERQLAVVLPADPALDDMTRIVNRAGQASGIVIDSIANVSTSEQSSFLAAQERAQDTSLSVGVVPLAFTLKVRGTYQQMRAFHEQLEKSPRLVDVVSLNYERNSTQPDQVVVTMRLRFYTFQTITENDGQSE